MHHHETRDHRSPGQVDAVAPAGTVTAAASPTAAMLPSRMIERLVFARRRAGAVNDAHVTEHDDRRVDLDEVRAGVRVRGLGHAERQDKAAD